VHYGEGSPQVVATALPENKGLVHFGLFIGSLDDHCWSELIAAISTHPTLRTFQFRDIRNADGRYSSSSTNVMRFHFPCRLILMTRMHLSLLVLNVISPGSCFLRSQRSRNRQPVLASWREPWLVRRRNLRWYGGSSLRTTTSFAVTRAKHVTTPSRFRRERAGGRLLMMTSLLTTRSCLATESSG
jgi:hypothetical protein